MSIIHRFPYSGSSVAGCNCIGTAILIYILRQKKNFSLETDRRVTEIHIRDKKKIGFRDKQKMVICFSFLFVSKSFLVTDTRLYTLPCRSVRPSVGHISEFRAFFCGTAPAQPFATGLPCIRPCLML